MTALNILAIFCVLCGWSVAVINYGEFQDEFNSFIDMVDTQKLEQDEKAVAERKYDLVYNKGNQGIVDRHGRKFVNCMRSNSDSGEEPMKLRCYKHSHDMQPACTITYDYLRNHTIQDCNDAQEFKDVVRGDCTDECQFQVSKYHAQHTGKQAIVGHCCCKTDRCNVRSMEQLAVALKTYEAEEAQEHQHHHHHHKQIRESSGFMERLPYF